MTNDTLGTNHELLAGDVAALPNVLKLKIIVGSSVDNVVNFSEDLYNFITPEGMPGMFSPIDLHVEFSTKKITAPGIETRCLFQGEKQ